MKILLTGSGSFLGGNLIRKAIFDQGQKGSVRKHAFSSIDRISNNALANMYWNKSHSFHIADIRDQHVMDIIFQFEKPDLVIHAAAETSVEKSLKDPNSFITSNVLGTQVILNCCIKHQVKKIIYCSTDQVYGQLVSEQDAPWTEENLLNPRNPYAASKACGELLVKTANQTHGLAYNIIRISNCYGARQLSEKLIPKAIKCGLQGDKITVYGQGLQIRDWMHIDDFCSALMMILEQGQHDTIYNVGAGQEFTNLEVAHEICKTLGFNHDLIQFVEDPRGSAHDFRVAMNCSKIRQMGWRPACKFKDGIKETVQWYVNNRFAQQ